MKDGSIWDVVRLVAPELGIKPGQLRLWKHRGRVPYKQRIPIADLAKRRLKRTLTLQDFGA